MDRSVISLSLVLEGDGAVLLFTGVVIPLFIDAVLPSIDQARIPFFAHLCLIVPCTL